MFLPDGGGHELRLPLASNESGEVHCVVGNRERSLYAVVTSSTIYVFLPNPQLILCSFRRTTEDVTEKGEYRLLYWKHDSTAVCLTTSKNCILVYRVEINDDRQCYNLTEPRDEHLRRCSQELFIKEKRPTVTISLAILARLESPAACVVPLRDEIFVCLRDGWMHRILWNGLTEAEYSFHLSDVPFAVDQLQSKSDYVRENKVFVSDIVYTPLLGGFCIVLSDGRAALLTSSNPRFHPKQLLAVWALQMLDAICAATNHKFRLILFGCKNGDISAYQLDDSNGALTCAYRVKLHVRDGPDLPSRLGSVSHIECIAQGTSFAAVWNSVSKITDDQPSQLPPCIAIFSPFGSQIWCSLESMTDCEGRSRSAYHWVDWGPEGYSLWLGGNEGLFLMPLSRSITVGNPNMEHIERIIFISDHRVYISPAKEKEQSASAPHSVWSIFNIPHDYLSTTWPIRFAVIDKEKGKWLAVAGTRGFAHCNIQNLKWRLFGNESQEKDILVTGGLAIWQSNIIIACYDIYQDRDELRFYPLDCQLDNQFCTRHVVDARILMMSRRMNKLVTFDMDAVICIYSFALTERSKKDFPKIVIERCAEIRILDLVPHPACVASVQLTSLNHASPAAVFCDDIDTVLVNVSGRLIMLSPMKKEEITDADDDDNGESRFQLNQPMLIASNVEQMWHDASDTPSSSRTLSKPHLAQSLWLNCGEKGMKVWIPLFMSEARKHSFGGIDSARTFINKRIMLPFDLDIYPLVICSHDCLSSGAESIPSFPHDDGCVAKGSTPHPLYNLHRNSEVFLHHLLRQLLKRNLGVYALEIAGTCMHLPYFGHVLELLLHHVLEEEATSSDAIPDPLLPRVVAFIKEFPEFLQTVAHCARKTELALWHALFAVTSHPKELFETCVRDGQLETAASFLIVLQNMENSSASREHAALLLDEALNKHRWIIARDIVRFLRAIDPSDIDSSPKAPACHKPHQNMVSAVSRRANMITSTNSDETDAFVYGTCNPRVISRTRHSNSESVSGSVTVQRKESAGSTNVKRISKTVSIDSQLSPGSACSSMHIYVQNILDRHAASLLEDCSIRDLGAFGSHLDFNLVEWLKSARMNIARIQDFSIALMRLHAQFKWPYPLVSQVVVDQLTRRIEHLKLPRNSLSAASFVSPPSIGSRLSSPVSDESGISNEAGVALCARGGEPLLADHNSSAPTTPAADEDVVVVPLRKFNENNIETATRPPSPSSVSCDTISNAGSDWDGLQRICGEAAARGSQESEVELKYMLDLMHESGCVDWMFLLCILRRDITYLSKHLTADFIRQNDPQCVERVQKGISQLVDWADSNCLGYRTLVLAFERHFQVVIDELNSGIPCRMVGTDQRITRCVGKGVVLINERSSKETVLNRQTVNGYVRSSTCPTLTENGNAGGRGTGIGAYRSKGTSVPKAAGRVMNGDLREVNEVADENLLLDKTKCIVKQAFTPPDKLDCSAKLEGWNMDKTSYSETDVVSHVHADEPEQCLVM